MIIRNSRLFGTSREKAGDVSKDMERFWGIPLVNSPLNTSRRAIRRERRIQTENRAVVSQRQAQRSSLTLFDRQERAFANAAAIYDRKQRRDFALICDYQAQVSHQETHRFVKRYSKLNPVPFLRDDGVIEDVAAARFGFEVDTGPPPPPSHAIRASAPGI